MVTLFDCKLHVSQLAKMDHFKHFSKAERGRPKADRAKRLKIFIPKAMLNETFSLIFKHGESVFVLIIFMMMMDPFACCSLILFR